MKVSISKALIEWYVNHGELASVNNELRGYNEIKQKIKNPQNAMEYTI